MTQQERFLATLLGGSADRFPFFDLEPADSTLELWWDQGLPEGTTVAEHFRLETHESVGLEVRSAPFYEMAPDLLESPDAFDRHYDPGDPDRLPPRLEGALRTGPSPGTSALRRRLGRRPAADARGRGLGLAGGGV